MREKRELREVPLIKMIIDNIFFIVAFLNMQCLAYEIKMYKLKKTPNKKFTLLGLKNDETL